MYEVALGLLEPVTRAGGHPLTPVVLRRNSGAAKMHRPLIIHAPAWYHLTAKAGSPMAPAAARGRWCGPLRRRVTTCSLPCRNGGRLGWGPGLRLPPQ